jgi:DNA-binding transcriptional regulator YhcF (GntR family)
MLWPKDAYTFVAGSMKKYEEIAERLRNGIETGDYPVGEAIPSQLKLGEAFGVSQITVRKAMDVLEHDGYIRKGNGRGNGSVVISNDRNRVRKRIGYHFGIIGNADILDSQKHDAPYVVKGMISELYDFDAAVSLFPMLSERYPSATSYIRDILARNLTDGLFVFQSKGVEELCEYLREQQFPFVRIVTSEVAASQQEIGQESAVVIDELPAFRRAIVESGCSQVVLLGAEEDFLPLRTSEILKRLTAELGLPFSAHDCRHVFSPELKERLKECARPEILTVTSDCLIPHLEFLLREIGEQWNLLIFQHWGETVPESFRIGQTLVRPFAEAGRLAAVEMRKMLKRKARGEPMYASKKICLKSHVTPKQKRNEK